MAARRFGQWLMSPSPRAYLTSLVTGTVLTQMGEHMKKGRPKPELPGPEPHPSEPLAQIQPQMDKRQEKLASKSKPSQTLSSMNPMQWELPTPSNMKRAMTLGKFAHHMSQQEELHKHLENVSPEALQQVQDHLKVEATHGTQQLGMNLMMMAPLHLIPGPAGFAARAFVKAKTVGNLGHSLAELERATGSDPGPLMTPIHGQLDSSGSKPK